MLKIFKSEFLIQDLISRLIVNQNEISVPDVPKNFNCLISCQLETTVFTRPVFIFSKLSYFKLNFGIGIKQSKIG